VPHFSRTLREVGFHTRQPRGILSLTKHEQEERAAPYFLPLRTALRKTSQPSLHLSNRDRNFLLSGYSINDFNSSTTRTGITYHAFIGRAYATSASIFSAVYDRCS